MKTRFGKIARLPKALRDELNQRLENGEDGESLLKWLNKTAECKQMLAGHFDGKPINKQNLSDWRQGGHQDWLRNQEARERVQAMAEQAEDLEHGSPSLADRLATVLTLQLADMTRQLDSVTDPAERWKQTKEILRELHRLRREDHHAQQIRLAREKWEVGEMDKEEEAEREQEKARKKWLLDTFHAYRNLPMTKTLLGGGAFGAKWAIWKMCVKQDLPMPSWWDPENPQFEMPPGPEEESKVESPMSKVANDEPVRAGQGESSSVKASQGELSPKSKAHPPSSDYGATSSPKSGGATQDVEDHEPVKASQGESRSEHEAPTTNVGEEIDCEDEDEPGNTGLPTSSEMKEIIHQKIKEAELGKGVDL